MYNIFQSTNDKKYMCEVSKYLPHYFLLLNSYAPYLSLSYKIRIQYN